jgi:hypothetical protein
MNTLIRTTSLILLGKLIPKSAERHESNFLLTVNNIDYQNQQRDNQYNYSAILITV